MGKVTRNKQPLKYLIPIILIALTLTLPGKAFAETHFVFTYQDENEVITGILQYKENECSYDSYNGGQSWDTHTSYEDCLSRATTIQKNKWCNADYSELTGAIWNLITVTNVCVAIPRIIRKIMIP